MNRITDWPIYIVNNRLYMALPGDTVLCQYSQEIYKASYGPFIVESSLRVYIRYPEWKV